MSARFKWTLLATGLLALVAIALFLHRIPLSVERPVEIVPRFLTDLPEPGEDTPYAIIDARNGAFPLEAVRLFADSATVLPSGSSPVSAFLPILDAAAETTLVLTERENGLYMYGAFSLDDHEIEALGAMTTPQAWHDHLTRPTLSPLDTGDDRYQIGALNMSSPLYLELDREKRAAYLSDSLFDMEHMREVRGGGMPGVAHQWTDYGDWDGHLYLSDGGLAARIVSENGLRELATEDPVKAEIRWQSEEPSSRDRTLSDTVLGGRAEWRVNGLDAILGKTFLASLKPYDWSSRALFLPEPLILSFGLNLPDPGRNTEALPAPLRNAATQLTRMRLQPTEVRNLLTGPFVLSLGGRTQVLWFDLPGLVLDLPERGEAADHLIDRFWTETFFGTTPKPVEGYAYGGAVDLPFTVMAASNGEKTVIGLTTPDIEHNTEVAEILKNEPARLGWLFVDLPKLGNAIAEMPTFNAILNDDEGMPMEEDATRSLRDSMTRLGRFFVSFESANSGHALWYD